LVVSRFNGGWFGGNKLIGLAMVIMTALMRIARGKLNSGARFLCFCDYCLIV